jgi:hypothetical protein
MGQNTPSEQKHIVVPSNGSHGVRLSAISIERGVNYTVVTLKGNVEIKTPVCLPVGKKGAPICDGEMIVRADEATFHEVTAEIEAHGNVVVTPIRHEPKK